MSNELNLHEVSISKLFNGEKCTFQIPIYQRNYAWEKDEIEALINDVYDASKGQEVYYIGTLVSYRKEDNVFEVIDGQQRLTTIRIILSVFKEKIENKLTYRARKKSDKTLEKLEEPDALDYLEEKDIGIENGLKFAKEALEDKFGKKVLEDKNDNKNEFNEFKKFFLHNVHIIHYMVPRDIDLNHYFEVMNSRGEQLEKHEIVKAKLMKELDEEDAPVFNEIWQACSQMSVYIQDVLSYNKNEVFSEELNKFTPEKFDFFKKYSNNKLERKKIKDIIKEANTEIPKEKEVPDSFQPIIDFPNFLLIVLKITRILEESKFQPTDFILDDKELLNEFEKKDFKRDADWVKRFAFNLLKSKFFLDNYIVHHSTENESTESNPWQLETYNISEEKKKYLKNLCDNDDNHTQHKLVQLLSMFEVSFTARQRKNYLFYCLYYLMTASNFKDIDAYLEFVEKLSDRYFYSVYLDTEDNTDKKLLNEINTPKPGSFDQMILNEKKNFNLELPKKTKDDFIHNFGDVDHKSKGIPLFVFNYLDYKIWKMYADKIKGKKLKEDDPKRKEFFARLGCNDFGLDIFENFYFSRTRRSLEHFYPQANVKKPNSPLNEVQINCFGNYAMIGAQANSDGSNWEPTTKIQHYKKDSSGKINRISVASLKFWIMMQICEDKKKWEKDEIKVHQDKMMKILFTE